jgi:predicted transcriptional regulator
MSNSQGSDDSRRVIVATKLEKEANEALKAVARANRRSRSAEAEVALLRHIEREAA